MRNLSSAVLSLAAMVLSSLTTYLTFFDSRYTLTAATADVTGQIQTSSSSNEMRRSLSFRTFVTPSVILSNRGTRAVVVTDVELVKSTSAEACEIPEDAEAMNIFGGFEARIIEPDSVQQLSMEFPLPRVDAEAAPGQDFQLEPIDAAWCLRWTVFDPNGNRHEPLVHVFNETTRYVPDEDRYRADFNVEPISGPTRLVTRGLY